VSGAAPEVSPPCCPCDRAQVNHIAARPTMPAKVSARCDKDLVGLDAVSSTRI